MGNVWRTCASSDRCLGSGSLLQAHSISPILGYDIQNHISKCLLNVFSGMSNECLKDIAETELLLCPPKPALPPSFPISVEGNSIFLVAQAKTLVILDAALSLPTYIRSICKSYWSYLQNQSRICLLPPVLWL